MKTVLNLRQQNYCERWLNMTVSVRFQPEKIVMHDYVKPATDWLEALVLYILENRF